MGRFDYVKSEKAQMDDLPMAMRENVLDTHNKVTRLSVGTEHGVSGDVRTSNYEKATPDYKKSSNKK